ncbi:cobyrinic acid a,c-diamide synthase [Domibacillus antri]|uniref:Cobyrinic acid a,c-diamide synthase n=1 Tax=Domibacillus antri TaxID=1714264 RepID=A0A1Q8Q1V2_9BACI|nr:AAA family ATPase [Domibacillus antri]OLN21319.1 cobyrinic acid a,c-diamide synthase [Domibacillus antri]
MKIISIFNNKGGVGKTNLTFHLAYALSELGKRVLLIDLDPQCNLTIYGMKTCKLHEIWEKENDFIESFDLAKQMVSKEEFNNMNNEPRTIHYLLKPTEEGTGELETLPPSLKLTDNLHLIPGRLTLHKYEEKIASRWDSAYSGEPLSLRTLTRIRSLAVLYAQREMFDFVIVDTSPSLSPLNKTIISTADGFLIPCMPDMFSLYGIRNIGNSLSDWKRDFEIINERLTSNKRTLFPFPDNFVKFLGFTVYNAKKYSGAADRMDLAQAHFNYVQQIPSTIREFIKPEIRDHLDENMIENPVCLQEVMHSHNTLPGMAQKYKLPIWKIPSHSDLEKEDVNAIRGNRATYERTQTAYKSFAVDMLKRIEKLN